MFRLRHQICCNPSWIPLIAKHNRLRRPRLQINRTVRTDQLFCSRHILIARSQKFSTGAIVLLIGECVNRLRTAATCQRCGSQRARGC